MKHKNKKGIEDLGFLTRIVLALIVGGVFILFFTNYIYPLILNEEPIKRCEQSIYYNAMLKKVRTGEPLKHPDCDAWKTEIKYDEVVDPKTKTIDQYKASKIIADEMVKCWSMVGKGTVDPFSNYDFKEEPLCIVCSRLEFDEELKQFMFDKKQEASNEAIFQRQYTIHPPFSFLIKAPLPNDKKERSYYNFLYGKDPTQDQLQAADLLLKQDVTDGSLILVQMIKLKEKGVLKYLGDVFTLPEEDESWSEWLNFGPELNLFSSCSECNAIGGIYFVSEEILFNAKQKMQFGDDIKELPLCSIIANGFGEENDPLKERFHN